MSEARRQVEEAEAAYARVEAELKSIDEQMMLDSGVGPTERLKPSVIQAEPLLDRLIAAEEAVQSAKEAERQAQSAVYSQ